jgi:hypothetical protein
VVVDSSDDIDEEDGEDQEGVCKVPEFPFNSALNKGLS